MWGIHSLYIDPRILYTAVQLKNGIAWIPLTAFVQRFFVQAMIALTSSSALVIG